jgi:hypothetical protein
MRRQLKLITFSYSHSPVHRSHPFARQCAEEIKCSVANRSGIIRTGGFAFASLRLIPAIHIEPFSGFVFGGVFSMRGKLVTRLYIHSLHIVRIRLPDNVQKKSNVPVANRSGIIRTGGFAFASLRLTPGYSY